MDDERQVTTRLAMVPPKSCAQISPAPIVPNAAQLNAHLLYSKAGMAFVSGNWEGIGLNNYFLFGEVDSVILMLGVH